MMIDDENRNKRKDREPENSENELNEESNPEKAHEVHEYEIDLKSKIIKITRAYVSSDKTQVVYYNRMRHYKVREQNSESFPNFSGISLGICNQGSQQEALFKICRERNAKTGSINSEVSNLEENELINFDANSDEANLVNNLEQVSNKDENLREPRDIQTNLKIISQNLVVSATQESSQAVNMNQLVNQNQSKSRLENSVQINAGNRSEIIGLDDTLKSLMDEILNADLPSRERDKN
ncbi:unnamed protein product [Brachionus calyciflorus]|uniref:Uncharacterized protein n=1 Tax=Brachionus calyciflorus TaxID=104777 RepID=A0A813PID8_9BILA|nr:unnamed protein product [Brachionus calyciflorus]